MKKIITLAFLLFFLIYNIRSQQLQLTYQFGQPVFIENNEGYTEVVFDEAANFNSEGLPLIPHFGAKALLPPGMAIESIEVVSTKFSKRIPNIKIQPASKEFPISVGAPEGYRVVPDETVYGSEEAYPQNPVWGNNTQFLSGHAIGQFTICPMVYYPADEAIRGLQEITIRIQYASSSKATDALTFFHTNDEIIQRLTEIVINPEGLTSYEDLESTDTDENDILLITKESLASAFDDYVDYKTETGFLVEVITVEDIYSNYTGADNQEKIRNCIIDYNTNYGTSYVILGGDSDPQNINSYIVPHRGLYAEGEFDIPSDMYYSCLDGNWNDDGDNRWGEVGEYDIYSEVYIGRICADNASEIENATHKLYMYQNEPVVEDIEKGLMIGEELNDNPQTWGGDYKDQIADGTSAHGFTTEGISENWTINYLYDRDGGWNRSDAFNEFNIVGINLMNHLGHSNTTYNMKMYNSHLTTSNFTNDGITRGYVIGYSQGCYNGSFDNRLTSPGNYTEDCFAEKFQTLETGEVACIANSRYGWYSPGNTNSSSQYHDRQFFDALFGEDIYEIGAMNSDAQGDNASYMDDWGLMRWTVYEANLFGDPSMDIWTAQPTDIIASYPASVPVGISQIYFDTDAAYARIGLVQNNELIGRGLADENGDLMLTLFEPIISTENIALSIIAHNRNRYMDTIIVVNDEPYVIHHDHTYNDGAGGNGVIDYGETIAMTLDMKNVGNEPASNVDVSLLDGNEYITLIDSNEYYGNFEPEEIVSITDGFQFQVSEFVPDQTSFVFEVEAIGDTTWTSYMNGIINAPILAAGHCMINDSEFGNGNGYLDPGETVSLSIFAQNTGHSHSGEVLVGLTTDCDYVTIVEDEVNVGVIEAGAANEAIFTVEVAEETPVGTFAGFNCDMNAEPYNCTGIYNLKIGHIIEDWETGDFGKFNWLHSGDALWLIDDAEPFEGLYCARSGEIDDEQKSRLFIAIDVNQEDSITFYRKVSSEVDYDYLNFYLDMTVVGQWAGETEWEREAFAVSGGMHMFQWIYEKDTYVSGGDDCAWIDYISLPMSDGFFVGVTEGPMAFNQKDLIVYPNPFKERLNLIFQLSDPGHTSIALFNLNGTQVKTLQNEAYLEEGLHQLTWNEGELSAGVYYLVIKTNKQVITQKIIHTH